MKTVKITLSREFEYIEIYTMSDLHLGDRNCNYKEILATVEEIAAKPNAFVLLNGDLINNATTQSISDTYAESVSPMDQLKQATALFKPIKDKILAITSGNHENRTYRADGIDLTEIMARELGVGDRYAPESVLLFIRVGKESRGRSNANLHNQIRQVFYTIYMTHGSGGGRREGGKINRLVDLSGIVDADIYVHSHTHMPAIVKEAFYRTDTRNSSVAMVDKMFVNTNAWLGYGGYGEAQGYKPASIKQPIIYLNGKRKNFTAKL